MREDVVPYVVSIVFLSATGLLVAGYALYRKLNVKKTDYGFYGDGGPPEAGGGGDTYEMQQQNGEEYTNGNGVANGNSEYREVPTAAAAAPVPAAAPVQAQPEASNPFKNKAKGSNPFAQ